MLLQDVLSSLPKIESFGNTHIQIKTIEFDSRKVTEGALFVATKGTNTDGHLYIETAIQNGAIAVVCEELPATLHPNTTYILTPNSQKALGLIAANFYGNPSKYLKVVAVTGTNGKTTTATLLYKLFRLLGYSVGLISTVENKINDITLPAQMTTPDALTIQKLLANIKNNGCTHCFMEASSHAIVQERLAGLELDGAIFTNITHDHLDYHKTFDNYIAAKKKLFDDLPQNAFALVNIDDKRGKVMLQNCKANTQKTFALKSPADFKAKILTNSFDGLLLDINNQQVWFRLIGEFNAYNLVGIYATAVLLGEKPQEILLQLSQLTPANGRFDKITSSTGIHAVIDYAHTPDALQNVLETIRLIRTVNEQIITVVGCGGDRDRTKRPVMAKIAATLSDKVFLTADNPRSEDVISIINEMYAGLTTVNLREKTVIEPDRRKAIEYAIQTAQIGDIVLIAGKGHETYQEIKGVKYHFDDRQEVIRIFNSL